MGRLWKRLREQEEGATAVEATIGIILLVLVVLAVMQILLYGHAALAARQAATAAARSYALTGRTDVARHSYEVQKGYTLGIIDWQPVGLSRGGGRARATVRVSIPPIFPGAGALTGGGGLIGPIVIEEVSEYPIGDSG